MPEGQWTSRAVVRFIEPGNLASCAHCDAEVKFQARIRAKQVICNVYEDQRWVRVEHYLQERWGVRVTHTISDEAMQRMEEEIAASERAEDGEPLQPSGRTRT